MHFDDEVDFVRCVRGRVGWDREMYVGGIGFTVKERGRSALCFRTQ